MRIENMNRFWSKVKLPEQIGTDECWEWQACRQKHNHYGNFSANGKSWRSHRFIWTVLFGDIPNGLRVLHKCDNPTCVNPDHLFLGTQADNMHDMDTKGRRAIVLGEDRWLTKLNNEQVRYIWEMTNRGESQRAIARELGVCHTTVGSVLRGRTWSHVER